MLKQVQHDGKGERMSTYTATIRWSRTGDGDFAKGRYSRAHLKRHPELVSGSIFGKNRVRLRYGC